MPDEIIPQCELADIIGDSIFRILPGAFPFRSAKPWLYGCNHQANLVLGARAIGSISNQEKTSGASLLRSFLTQQGSLKHRAGRPSKMYFLHILSTPRYSALPRAISWAVTLAAGRESHVYQADPTSAQITMSQEDNHRRLLPILSFLIAARKLYLK